MTDFGTAGKRHDSRSRSERGWQARDTSSVLINSGLSYTDASNICMSARGLPEAWSLAEDTKSELSVLTLWLLLNHAFDTLCDMKGKVCINTSHSADLKK